MKYYNLGEIRAWQELPDSLYIWDSNVAIRAALGNIECLRVLDSQDKTGLRFGAVHGTQREVNYILKKEYNGVGYKWFNEILSKRNFSILDLTNYIPPIGGIRGVLDTSYKKHNNRKEIGEKLDSVDKDIIKLVFVKRVKGIISGDHDIIDNARLKRLLKSQKKYVPLYSPQSFCEDYNSELINYGIMDKLSIRLRISLDRLRYHSLRI